MAKIKNRVVKERRDTSRLNPHLISYDFISKFQEWEIGSDSTFKQSKIIICKTDFSQTLLQVLAFNVVHPNNSTVKMLSWLLQPYGNCERAFMWRNVQESKSK